MTGRIRIFAAFVLTLLLPLVACDSDTALDGGGRGRVTLLLTDAPGDIHAAVVTISEVYLKGDGGEVVLLDEEVTTDLLTLKDDILTLAEEVVVPSGTYAEVRVVITGGYIEVEGEDGETRFYVSKGYEHVPADLDAAGELELHMPSYATSGLKIKLPGGLRVDGDERIVLLDFDVAESFGQEVGKSGRWVMKPVIKVTEVDLAEIEI